MLILCSLCGGNNFQYAQLDQEILPAERVVQVQGFWHAPSQKGAICTVE